MNQPDGAGPGRVEVASVDPPVARAHACKAGIDVGLIVTDLRKTLEFYCESLGLEDVQTIAMSWGTMHRLRFGESWLKLIEPTAPATPQSAFGLQAAYGIRYLTLDIGNIDEIWSQAIGSDAKSFRDLGLSGDGSSKIGILEDPDGNLVELVQRQSPT